MDKTELVAEWLRLSNMDLDTAKNLIVTMHPAPLEIICFHCQQAAEKFLKAALVGFNEEPEKTHDLLKVVNALRKFVDIPMDLPNTVNALTPFATKARYPLPASVDAAQTKRAIAQAEKVKAWAESVIAEQSK